MKVSLRKMTYVEQLIVQMKALEWQKSLPPRESIEFHRKGGAIGLPTKSLKY